MTPHGTLSGSSPGERVATAKSAALDASLAHRLRDIVGDDAVITDPGALLVYESDGLMAYRARPLAVVLPRDTAQVSAIVRLLADADVPFVARGAGTGLSGGALALRDAVVISVARMDRILRLDPANRIAVVQPGVVNVRLTAAASPHGLHYAPDPSSQTVCTIGGNVAENAGGPHCLKYGVTANHIAGATVVLPDGEVVRLGGAGRESPGYDLLGLFIGSEGTFGIATEIEVRLAPLPEAVATLLAVFDDIDDASRAVSEIIARGLLPAALEMVDREAIAAVEASTYAAGMPTDVAGALVIEFDGPAAGLDEDADRAREICLQLGARDVRLAADEAERQRLWHARKKAFGAMGRLAPDVLVQDAVVPRSALPVTLARVYEIAGRYGLRLCNMFHAGDGNLHPTILFDRREPAQVEAVEHASREMMRACVEAGGTITGEHGVGLDKREYMSLVFGDAELEAMCAVRRVWNPRGLANPEKILPIRSCREWIGPATRRMPGPGDPAEGGTTRPGDARTRVVAARGDAGECVDAGPDSDD
jgi:glycolate oxidase subunit GlcD